jgi:PTS system cellobiose-specific IIC component
MLPSSAESRQSSAGSNSPFGWLEARFAPLAHTFGEAPVILALRDGLPFSFIGLVLGLAGFLLFAVSGNPVERFHSAFAKGTLVFTLDVGFTAMSVALILTLAVVLAQRVKYPLWLSVPTMIGAFALSLPHPAVATLGDYAKALGPSGLFLAIVVALTCTAAMSFGRRKLGPSGLYVGAVGVLALAGLAFSLHFSLASLLAGVIAPLASLGDTYTGLLVIALLQTALWLVGIHGPALLAAVVTPIYLNLQLLNTAEALHHHPLEHIVVVSTFLFVFPGGAGATLPLTILLLRSKSSRLRKVALAGIVPSLFNTNEPILLGIPLVFNPYLAIPFLLAPAVLVTTTYVSMATNLVSRPAYYIPSSVPTVISVFLATLDWRAVVLVVINIGLAMAIYAPFVRIYERAEVAREQAK